MADFQKSFADIFGGLTVVPDPDPCDVERDERKSARAGTLSLLVDRGCPLLVAEAVANVNGSERVLPLDAITSALGWLAMDEAKRGRIALVLSGERGRGKSFAAGHVLARQRPGTLSGWVNARRLADLMHNSRDPASRALIDRARMAPMLVIDDMGWEHLDQHGYIRGAIVGFVDDRIMNKRRTVMTMNIGEDKFKPRYGDAFHDRVRGYGTWVDVKKGPSLR